MQNAKAMIKIAGVFISVFAGGLLSSCSQTATNSNTCGKSGLFGSQAECQSSTSGVCTMTTISASGSSTVCWQNTSQLTNTNSGTTTNTNTNTSGGLPCTGSSAPPYTLGAWTPTTCAPGVTQRTRSVTCLYNCACSQPAPSDTETCAGDLYNGLHYSAQCTAAGGSVNNNIDGGKKACVFSATACPGGWSPVVNAYNIAFTATTPGTGEEHTSCTGGRTNRSTSSHSMNSMPVETLSICTWRSCLGCKGYTTIYANVSQVACY